MFPVVSIRFVSIRLDSIRFLRFGVRSPFGRSIVSFRFLVFFRPADRNVAQRRPLPRGGPGGPCGPRCGLAIQTTTNPSLQWRLLTEKPNRTPFLRGTRLPGSVQIQSLHYEDATPRFPSSVRITLDHAFFSCSREDCCCDLPVQTSLTCAGRFFDGTNAYGTARHGMNPCIGSTCVSSFWFARLADRSAAQRRALHRVVFLAAVP